MKDLLIETRLLEMMRRIGENASAIVKVNNLQGLLRTELVNLGDLNLIRDVKSMQTMTDEKDISVKKLEIQLAQVLLAYFLQNDNFNISEISANIESKEVAYKIEKIKVLLSDFIESNNEESIFLY